MCRFLCVLTLIMAACITAPAEAQVSRSGLIPETQIERYGLSRAWFTNVELDRSRGRIAHTTLHVSPTITFRVFDVVFEEGVRSFSERYVDNFGDPMGVEGARQQARQFMNQMRDMGRAVELDTRDVPAVTLLVQTDRAMLHAIDGETGRTLWAQRIGNPDYPSTEPAANDEYVAVLNGSTLYIIERASGKLLWDKRVGGAPGAGPALSGNRVFVPMATGELESYLIDEPEAPRFIIHSAGRALIQPTVTRNTLSWPTDRGLIYVQDLLDKDSSFRFEAHNSIVAPSMHRAPDQLLVSSIDGYVYSIDERFGTILWRFSAGAPMSEAPVVIMNSVYAVTDRSGMYCVDADSGEERWWTPNISRFLASSPSRVYCMGESNDLRIIDKETGGRIGSLSVPSIDFLIVNPQTDRIYIGTRAGLIQCLHETDIQWPEVYLGKGSPEQELPEVIQGGGEGENTNEPEQPETPDNNNPFGDRDDIFGEPAPIEEEQPRNPDLFEEEEDDSNPFESPNPFQ